MQRKRKMFNIVLLEPQIHTNTGSIGRMCVNANCVLHLIKPFGFIIDDKHLRRAGLDYWARLDVRIYEDLSEFYAKNAAAKKRSFFATTKTDTLYFEASFEPGDYLFFGREDAGLPLALLKENESRCITIPMSSQGRSLNLATSVGIITYEAIRQNFKHFNLRKSIK